MGERDRKKKILVPLEGRASEPNQKKTCSCTVDVRKKGGPEASALGERGDGAKVGRAEENEAKGSRGGPKKSLRIGEPRSSLRGFPNGGTFLSKSYGAFLQGSSSSGEEKKVDRAVPSLPFIWGGSLKGDISQL